jgi:hypothetical protein
MPYICKEYNIINYIICIMNGFLYLIIGIKLYIEQIYYNHDLIFEIKW